VVGFLLCARFLLLGIFCVVCRQVLSASTVQASHDPVCGPCCGSGGPQGFLWYTCFSRFCFTQITFKYEIFFWQMKRMFCYPLALCSLSASRTGVYTARAVPLACLMLPFSCHSRPVVIMGRLDSSPIVHPHPTAVVPRL